MKNFIKFGILLLSFNLYSAEPADEFRAEGQPETEYFAEGVESVEGVQRPLQYVLRLLETVDVFNLAWSKDNTQIAFAYKDKDKNITKVWNLINNEIVCGFNPLNFCAPKAVFVNVKSGKITSFSPDRTVKLISNKKSIEILPTGSNVLLGEKKVQFKNISSITWSPDGSKLAIGAENGNILIFDVNTLIISNIFNGHTKEVDLIEWSADSSLIASSSLDKTIRIWKLKS